MNFLIDFVDSTSTNDIDSYLSTNGLTKLKTYKNYVNVVLVSGDREPPTTEIVEKIIQDDLNGIQLLDSTTYTYTQDNIASGVANVAVSDDKNWWKVASSNFVDFNKETNEIPIRGKNTVVYLMDSGVEITHPEFTNRQVSNLFSFNDDFTDTKGHGTALAS